MISWFIAITAIGLLLLAVAMGGEMVCARLALPRRGLWLATMVAMFALPLVLALASVRELSVIDAISTPTLATSQEAQSPRPAALTTITTRDADAGSSTAAVIAGTEAEVNATTSPAGRSGVFRLGLADTLLPIAWGTLAVICGLAVLLAGLRLRHERSQWKPAPSDVQETLHAHCSPRTRVWCAPRAGPAAFGVVHADVVIPEWALRLDEPERTLLLMHEASHVEARDPLVLCVALALVILLPWHLPLLVAYRRLHRAVEHDCDARVVARTGVARAYGRLLVTAAARITDSRLTPAWVRVTPWLPSPISGMGVRRTELEARLEALIPPVRTASHRLRTTAIGVATLGMLAAACAVPTPHLAPVSSAPLEVVVRTAADTLASIAFVAARISATEQPVVLTHAGSGRYTGALPDSVREFALTILVPEHVPLQTKVMRPSGDRARFTVRLRPIIPRRVADNPRVIGDFNGFAVDKAVPLVAGADGVLRAAIPYRGDSARVQVLGVGTRGAWMPARGWALSPAQPELKSTWAGVITPRQDTLFIAIDTAGRRPDMRAPVILTEPYDSTASTVNSLLLARNDAWTNEQAMREWEPDRTQSLRGTTRALARSTLNDSRDPVVRAHALVTLLALASEPDSDIRADSRLFFELVRPGSRITYDRDALMAVETSMYFTGPDSGAPARDTVTWHRQITERVRSYVVPVARATTVDSMERKTAWLTTMYHLDAVKDPQIDAFIDEALAAFPKDPIILTLPQSMGTRRVLREGAAFPSFRLNAIGEPSTELSNATFAGKLTLVDFWGTWCGPCIVEMPFLHRAHERFRDRGFTILSIASDESVDVVRKFRGGQWKMPWLNAWTEGSGNSKALQALGVMHFPMAVLVGPDGKVIAIDVGLRGDALERTVERHLPR